MSEELLQRNLVKNPEKIGRWDFYNIGSTSLKVLKEYGIIRNVNYGSVENKKIDALIVQRKNVIAVIEYKKPSEFKTKKQQDKAIKQEIEVAQKIGSKIFIATDTNETVWVNSFTENRIKGWDGNEIKTPFDPKSEKMAELIEKIHDSINKQNDSIKPRKLINPTDLAKSIWQDIWSVSGATPENCLYSFVELFIFKYLSDLGVLEEPENFSYLIELYGKRDDGFVLEYYANNVRPKIKELFPENPIDKTTIINGTIFVSKDQKAVKGYSTTFKTVLDKFNKYGKLEYIDYDFKSQLFESFLKESISKKNWGQFFTPLKVVRSIVEMAKNEIKDGAKICDPACGVGKFLLEPLVTSLDHYYDVGNGGIRPKVTIHGYDKGFDKDEQKTIILAKANMLIYFSDLIKDNPSLTKDFASLFNDSFTLKTNSILGTLSDPVENEYDLILTNPPYVMSGSGNLKDEIKKDGDLVNYYKVNAMGVEGLFMEWIIRALKPGGKAFVVIPDGILNRQNDKNLRRFMLQNCYIDGIISLPLNTFFTTNKKTYILCLTKKENITQIQTAPVFTYLTSEIGETRDIYRFDIDQNDLHEAVTLYSFFKGNKTEFEKINSDGRCKIQPIDKFLEEVEKHWLVDRWWTDEEKINMGIVERKDKVSLLEFASIVQDVAAAIQEFQDEIKELSADTEKKKTKLSHKNYLLTDLFDPESGLSKYTKTYGNLHKGAYPVYSASNNAPLTYIDSPDYNGDYLTWATNGFAGYIKIISGKFSINADRGLLKPRKADINIKYVKHKLEPQLRQLAKGRRGDKGEQEFTKVYPSMLGYIRISMPINEVGNFDLGAQTEAVKNMNSIEEIKQKISDFDQQILEMDVKIEDEYSHKELKVSDIFEDTSGFAFKKNLFTVKKTDIPIIRIQNISEKRPRFVYYPVSEAVDQKFLIEKGDYLLPLSGSFFRLTQWKTEGKFYLNQRIAKFVLKREFAEKLDSSFLQVMLHIIEREIGKLGYSGNNNLRINDVKNIVLLVPVTKQGAFDMKAQKQIAEKYKKIEGIKSEIRTELRKISDVGIDI